MHLQQTKVGSRITGGPQYYFHDLPDGIKSYLRHKGACPVVLQTPYGIATSTFAALSRDHKLGDGGRVVRGRVGHDRIQQAGGTESIGEAIRRWYGLPGNMDFRRIEVEAHIHRDGHFIISPLKVYLGDQTRGRIIEQSLFPLSFNDRFHSVLWKKQIDAVVRQNPQRASWIHDQLQRLVHEHHRTNSRNMHEADLLRAAGALAKMGMQLGPYLVRYYDCDPSSFQFLNYPEYSCPVEVKKRSSGFKYQMLRYKPLPRAVVLCLDHDLPNIPDHIDVVELSYMAAFFDSL